MSARVKAVFAVGFLVAYYAFGLVAIIYGAFQVSWGVGWIALGAILGIVPVNMILIGTVYAHATKIYEKAENALGVASRIIDNSREQEALMREVLKNAESRRHH